MANVELLEFHPSLPEWFLSIGSSVRAEELRREDNTRTDRFRILRSVIGIPCDIPFVVPAEKLRSLHPDVLPYFKQYGQEPCAIRLVPRRQGLPKLRSRGLLLADCVANWFLQQHIVDTDYDAEIYRHSNSHEWSTIFVVDEHGIGGEIIRGQHNQLTKGETKHTPYRFWYNFTDWRFEPEAPPEARALLGAMVKAITVPTQEDQHKLTNELSSVFYSSVLGGYFETVVWETGEVFFIDYNRLLGNTISGAMFGFGGTGDSSVPNTLTGLKAFGGRAEGTARVIDPEHTEHTQFSAGNILIAHNTDVRYLPLMQKAGAIVTEQGGVLSHAAIVARELKKPCLVGVTGLLALVPEGALVQVDADNGIVTIL